MKPRKLLPTMWDIERDHPWRAAALYAAAILGAMLLSHFWPWGAA